MKTINNQFKINRKGKKVIFINGCFDILHSGHIHLFKEARKLGDILVVAVNSDASIRKIKGISRPVFPLKARLEILEAIKHIDYLVSFSEETPQEIIALIRPDILVKGADWPLDDVVGKKEVEENGGKVIIIPYLNGYSSSGIIERIIEKHEQ